MRGGAVQVEIAFLDIFGVIALIAGQSEKAFLEERVFAVPEREGEADFLMTVADACNAVLIPAWSWGSDSQAEPPGL
jgi:hypothetical protein